VLNCLLGCFGGCGVTPSGRGDAVVGAEPLDEVADVGVADAVAQRGHRQVGFGEQDVGLLHAPLGDPLLHCPSGLATHDGGEVAGGERQVGGDVGERDGFVVAPLDDVEDRRQDRRVGYLQFVRDVAAR
jgi:hypothetical protein